MKPKTLNSQYKLLKEGKGHKDVFLKTAKKQFPKFVHKNSSLKEAITILKQKGIISENVVGTPAIFMGGDKKEDSIFEEFNKVMGLKEEGNITNKNEAKGIEFSLDPVEESFLEYISNFIEETKKDPKITTAIKEFLKDGGNLYDLEYEINIGSFPYKMDPDTEEIILNIIEDFMDADGGLLPENKKDIGKIFKKKSKLNEAKDKEQKIKVSLKKPHKSVKDTNSTSYNTEDK